MPHVAGSGTAVAIMALPKLTALAPEFKRMVATSVMLKALGSTNALTLLPENAWLAEVITPVLAVNSSAPGAFVGFAG